MPSTPVSELIPVLQVAIGPVILVSGVGLLLLTLTNRYGRTIDRSRQPARELRGCTNLSGQRERFPDLLSPKKSEKSVIFQLTSGASVG